METKNFSVSCKNGIISYENIPENYPAEFSTEMGKFAYQSEISHNDVLKSYAPAITTAVAGLTSIIGIVAYLVGSKSENDLTIEQIEKLDISNRYECFKKLTKEQFIKLGNTKENAKRLATALKECIDVLKISDDQKKTDLNEFYEFMKEMNS